MSLDDRQYFYKRAEAELTMAQAARNPAAVRAHYTLAEHYLDRVYSGDRHVPAALDRMVGHEPIFGGDAVRT